MESWESDLSNDMYLVKMIKSLKAEACILLHKLSKKMFFSWSIKFNVMNHIFLMFVVYVYPINFHLS